MACQEHSCGDCELTWFDNSIHAKCPHCGSQSVSNLYDEDLRSWRADEEQLEQEEREDEYDESDWSN